MATLVLGPGAARADDVKVACIAAAEHAEQLRDEHKLLEARSEAARCAREECPDVVRRDCSEALREINRALPSITVRAKLGSADRVDVRVSIDGQEVSKRLDGTPIKLDPGVHVLRLEAPDAVPVEQQLIMIEGERTRIVDVTLEPRAPLSAARVAPPPAPSGERRIPTAAFVFGGVGLVGLASFTYFGLGARSGIDDLRASCAPYCADEQISDVQTKRIAADVSLGVGIVALGVATWLALRGEPVLRAAPAVAGARF